MRAAVKVDAGHFARKEVSMAKVQVADTLHLAVDTALQLNGARGYSKDTVLEWIYRYARQARRYIESAGGAKVSLRTTARPHPAYPPGPSLARTGILPEPGRPPNR
jgi:hypothetical protein